MKRKRHSQGSTLAMALVTIAVAAFCAWSVFYVIANRYQTMFHSASWQESLMVAESGADTAVAALNASLTNPATAWAAWTPSDATTFPKTYTGTFPAHLGDGNNKMYAKVVVDNSITDGSGQVWYRIRSKGTVELPGLHRVGYEPAATSSTGAKDHLNALRKLSYNTDATGGALHKPQVSRSVEVLAQPLTARIYPRSLVVQSGIALHGGAFTDSFDSSDPSKSNNGQYDPAKRQSHGDISSNSTGNGSNLNGSEVWGNAASNTGAMQNTSNVHGMVYNNFSSTIAPVSKPSFSSTIPFPTTVSNPPSPVTLTAGTQASPANYKLSTINISNGSHPLILAPPSPGQDSYINIWVTGDIATSGTGFIQLQAGVHATVYVEGNVTVSGTAFDNENGYASNLIINGVTPSDGSTRNFNISGTAQFVGVVYAPAYALSISGSGDFMGAMIMLSANLTGAAGYHYDESLGKINGGSGSGYKVASWIEDIE